jgi:hypothetical protein
MNKENLRDKIQTLYDSTNIKVSDFIIKDTHTLTCFYACNGNTYHIHGEEFDSSTEEVNRDVFYNMILERHESPK